MTLPAEERAEKRAGDMAEDLAEELVKSLAEVETEYLALARLQMDLEG
jgi:hypothetical protein